MTCAHHGGRIGSSSRSVTRAALSSAARASPPRLPSPLRSASAPAPPSSVLCTGVLIRELPYRDAERLVLVQVRVRTTGEVMPLGFTGADLEEWKQRSRALQSLALCERDLVALDSNSGFETLNGAYVSSQFFAVLGVRTALGRLPGDPAANEIVISDGLWRRRFESDPRVVGRQVRLNSGTHTIVGVLGPSVTFPVETRSRIGAPPTLPISGYLSIPPNGGRQIRRSARLSRAWLRALLSSRRAPTCALPPARGKAITLTGRRITSPSCSYRPWGPPSRRAPGWTALMLEEGARLVKIRPCSRIKPRLVRGDDYSMFDWMGDSTVRRGRRSQPWSQCPY